VLMKFHIVSIDLHVPLGNVLDGVNEVS